MKAALLELQRALEAERREKEAALGKQGQLEDELAAAQQARIELQGQVRSSAFEQSVATMDEGSKEKRLVDSEREREYLAMRSERLAGECETLREQKATLEARLRALEEQVERVNAAIGSVKARRAQPRRADAPSSPTPNAAARSPPADAAKSPAAAGLGARSPLGDDGPASPGRSRGSASPLQQQGSSAASPNHFLRGVGESGRRGESGRQDGGRAAGLHRAASVQRGGTAGPPHAEGEPAASPGGVGALQRPRPRPPAINTGFSR
jgi:hypothetical protein